MLVRFNTAAERSEMPPLILVDFVGVHLLLELIEVLGTWLEQVEEERCFLEIYM